MKQLLYFSASWCGQCRTTTPIIDKLTLEGLNIRKIDVGIEQHLGDKYHIMSLPSFIVEQDGKVIEQLNGVQSEARIREML